MNDMREAYDAAAPRWRRGPAQIYRRLADALLDRSPVDLDGTTVLDVGGGTGVGAEAALARGAARGVVTDLALGMLEGTARPAVVADAASLPFDDDSFDLTVEAFLLAHLPDPVRALSEARRVSTALVASAFAADWAHPAREIVDEVMTQFGFETPRWYAATKASTRVNSESGLAALARAAGWRDVTVHRSDVDVKVDTPAAMVRWRCGMAHVSPWLDRQPPDLQEAAQRRAEEAVAGLPPVVVPMLALSAR